MNITSLSPAIGAEIVGLDVAAISDAEFRELRDYWVQANGLLVIRSQALTPQSQTEFSRRFGPLFGEDDHFQDTVKPFLLPGYPTIYRVSNKKNESGEALGRARAGSYWHSDVSFRTRPAMASLLYAIEIPEVGGDTLFASQVAAFESLSTAMKEALLSLRAVHDFRVAAKTSGTYSSAEISDGDFDGQNRSVHPVVITHPESRRQALFVNPGFTSHLNGFDLDESRVILNFLYQHAVRPEFTYRHQWRQGDLVVWDNRAAMHFAIQDYSGDRYLHRSTVIADQPAQ